MTNWMTIDQAADYVKCSSVTLRREVKSGRLAGYRVGGRKALRFRPQDLDAWMLGYNCPIPGSPRQASRPNV